MTHPETRLRNEELKSYEDSIVEEELRAEEFEARVKARMEEVLNDDTLLNDFHVRYEVVDYGQVCRALRSLSDAINGYSYLYARSGDANQYPALDAVFTSLSNIQANLRKAVEHEQLLNL